MSEENKINWIWIPDRNPKDEESPFLALFRRDFYLKGTPAAGEIEISADSRYKLYANGQLVQTGPCKGDRQVWYRDRVDLLPYLKCGENVLAVEVLRYPPEHDKGNHGIFRTAYPGLYVCGEAQDRQGGCCDLSADEKWLCRKDEGFHIVTESRGFAPLQIYEDCTGCGWKKGWRLPGYDTEGWKQAAPYWYMSRAVSPGNLLPRPIPELYRRPRCFQEVMVLRQSRYDKEAWESFLRGERSLGLPPHTRETVEISAGEEMTGYLFLALQGGAGATITLLQSEAYVQGVSDTGRALKGKRDDWRSGTLRGYTDIYRPGGYGTTEAPETYEPFWFRTFRYVQMTIETGEQGMILKQFSYAETGYPLEVQSRVETSDPSHAGIWEISERTLRRCMHETYEDCPFYEQLQYAMDSRSQILYTYAVAADDRLARKCMEDFRLSQRYDGLLNCSYPCYGPNVIPGFSIYYILMLHDHMMYFGDRELLEEHMPTVERILLFYRRNLDEKGYVKKLGGLNGGDRFWSFIDWTREWDATTGVPAAILEGPITMESLLYCLGLCRAADIAEYLGRGEQARDYRQQAEQVREALRSCCMGRRGMLTDGPGVEQYSQHVQVFAVLTDTVTPEQGRCSLQETIDNRQDYVQCSVAMAFYLFRALEKTGLYRLTDTYWDIWRRMLENHLTTCVEDEVRGRSDCHAWGALILYELPSVILGVQPAAPGYQAVRIRPRTGYLTRAEGEVITPVGRISVSWVLEGEQVKLTYQVPDGVRVADESAAQ